MRGEGGWESFGRCAWSCGLRINLLTSMNCKAACVLANAGASTGGAGRPLVESATGTLPAAWITAAACHPCPADECWIAYHPVLLLGYLMQARKKGLQAFSVAYCSWLQARLPA